MFAEIFEFAPVALLVIDRDRRIKLANLAAERLFGYDPGELLERPVEILVPSRARSSHPALVTQFLANPSARPMGAGRDLVAVRKDGTEVPVEIGLTPIRGKDDAFVMSSIIDLTERVRARDLLRERTDELEQFAYRTSHDLRAPLLSMKGLGEFIVDDLAEGNVAEATVNARKIVSLSARLSELVEDILSLTRSDYVHEAPTEVDLESVVRGAREKLQLFARERAVRIDYFPAHARPLRSQPTRIAQIIDNLVSNGVKYADPDKSERRVVVRSYADARSFHLQVEDNGIGIPLNRHNEVFGIFKRFHPEHGPGSGLGLYLVKRHVQKLGGTVEFESSAAGTIFHVALPLRAGEPPRTSA